MGTRGPYFVAAIVLAACGGETGTRAARIVDDAGGGRSAPSPTTDAANGAGGSAASAGSAGIFGDHADAAPSVSDARENSACDFGHVVCGGLDSYVELQGDGGPLRLSYPLDEACGTCTGGSCELWSFAAERCGGVAVRLAACAGPAGKVPCLDTASPKPSYTDATGHAWATAYLSGLASQPGVTNTLTNVLDLDLTLRIDDGVVMQELPVHIHTCGDIRASLAPCH